MKIENEAGTVGIAATGYRQHSRCPRSERGLNRVGTGPGHKVASGS